MTVNNSFKSWMINTWLTHIEYKKLNCFLFFFYYFYYSNLRYHSNKNTTLRKKSLKAMKIPVAKVNINNLY